MIRKIRTAMLAVKLRFLALSMLVLSAGGAQADEYGGLVAPEPRPERIYTTHAPGLDVPGRYQAGPCEHGAPVGADYEAGVDAHGNPVVAADVSAHDAFHWSDPSLQYLMRRAPSPQEARYGLDPRDYVVLDAEDGSVRYNDFVLDTPNDLPPAPGLCD